MYNENTATGMCAIFKTRKRILLCHFTDQLKGATKYRARRRSNHVAVGFLFPKWSLFPPEHEELLLSAALHLTLAVAAGSASLAASWGSYVLSLDCECLEEVCLCICPTLMSSVRCRNLSDGL